MSLYTLSSYKPLIRRLGGHGSIHSMWIYKVSTQYQLPLHPFVDKKETWHLWESLNPPSLQLQGPLLGLGFLLYLRRVTPVT